MWHLLERKKGKDNTGIQIYLFFIFLKLVNSYWYGDRLELEAKEIKHDKD